MNKNQVAAQMVNLGTGITRELAIKTIDGFMKSIINELSCGNCIIIKKFGCFKISTQITRKRKNPKTGIEVVIPEHKTIKFISAKKLSDIINTKST